MLIHQGTRTIRTERLQLRRYMPSDAASMFQNYAADERVARFLTWTPYREEQELHPFLTDVIQSYEDARTYHWAMDWRGQVIGSISAYQIDEKNHSCEVGYCLGVSYWNRGVTSEALAAVLDYLFEQVRFHRIYAKHDVENPASGRVMEKCGMRCEGRPREHYCRHDGSYSDALIYGIVH